MKRLLVVMLASATVSAYAQTSAPVVVNSPNECPQGTAASVPSYHWEGGRFVRDGWACEVTPRRGVGG